MTMIDKRTIIFERTVTERVTVELGMSADSAERINSWANYGVGGASPFDLLPAQFPHRTKHPTDWQVTASDPPLPVSEPRGRIEHRRRKS